MLIYIIYNIYIIHYTLYIHIHIYISAEANMASRRVEAGLPILKTLLSPSNLGRVYPPLAPPIASARPIACFS